MANKYNIPPSWVLATKRTDDPKLLWIEAQLDLMRVPHKRGWPSFHASCTTWVPKWASGVVDYLLAMSSPGNVRRHYPTIDDIPDDHRIFNTPGGDKITVTPASLECTNRIVRRTRRPRYTVIRLHDDTGEVGADTVVAVGPHEAMSKVAKRQDSNTQIIGAIEGTITICPPCEDSGKAAWVVDLKGE